MLKMGVGVMQNLLRRRTILVLGFTLLMVGYSWPQKVDFFEGFIEAVQLAEDLKESIEKKQFEKSLILLQKIQIALDYIQIGADDLRVKITASLADERKGSEKNVTRIKE